MLTFSQSINLIDFNSSDSYAPGSGVSVHINPTGIFELSANSFVLELSAPGGDFTNPTVLVQLMIFIHLLLMVFYLQIYQQVNIN